MQPKTYCNPLPIADIPSGRWLDVSMTKDDPRSMPDYRSISDPSVVYHEGKWILYPSYAMAYVSTDFVHWTYVDIGMETLDGILPGPFRYEIDMHRHPTKDRPNGTPWWMRPTTTKTYASTIAPLNR